MELRSDWNRYGRVMMAVGAGIGIAIGVVVAGGTGIALGAFFGAGLGLLAAMVSSPQQRKSDR